MTFLSFVTKTRVSAVSRVAFGLLRGYIQSIFLSLTRPKSPLQITEQVVAHIIEDLDTWLAELPEWQREDSRYVIDLPVQNSEGINLRFVASKTNSASALPQFAYLLNNQRIRCIDWKTRRRSADGRMIEGWHEHVWSDKYGDNYVVEQGDFKHLPVERQIEYVLSRWKIEYKQLRLI